jgi:hypothetical protein
MFHKQNKTLDNWIVLSSTAPQSCFSAGYVSSGTDGNFTIVKEDDLIFWLYEPTMHSHPNYRFEKVSIDPLFSFIWVDLLLAIGKKVATPVNWTINL